MEWIEDDQVKVVRVYDESRYKWRQIGVNLGIDDYILDAIEDEHSILRARVTNVLVKWYENARGLPHADRYPMTWRGLINLLNNSDLMELAQKVHKALLQQEQLSKSTQFYTCYDYDAPQSLFH